MSATRPSSRQIKLGLFIQAAGHHVAGWRYPGAQSRAESLPLLQRIAQTAERGKFDLVFLGDGLTTSADAAASVAARFEPLTLLSALAVSTSHVGLAATASTTYGEPYHIARLFASLDHLSGGRAAWNIVTTSGASAAANFSKEEHLDHARRYARAGEFVEVVKGLWDSFEDGAILQDKETGRYLDKDKVHRLDHRGGHFSVAGPLNVSRTPQGHPVLIQAGSSDTGQDLAARFGEVIFTAQQTIEEGLAFSDSLRSRLPAVGRRREDVLIMPGVMPVIGGTEQEARAIYQALEEGIDLNQALRVLSERLGSDVSVYPLDEPLPSLPETDGIKSRAKLFTDLARRESLTIRQLARLAAGARGHRIIIGTPEQVAADFIRWFEAGAADGFNVMPPYFPAGLDAFVDHVVPLLQKRGLFRTEYEGTTLRDNLGLPVPENRYTLARLRTTALTADVA
jgi:FMN-dependent oxidoreductase (nitrilotriacetate monooxygenase family)